MGLKLGYVIEKGSLSNCSNKLHFNPFPPNIIRKSPGADLFFLCLKEC